jgi:hypothetical protein
MNSAAEKASRKARAEMAYRRRAVESATPPVQAAGTNARYGHERKNNMAKNATKKTEKTRALKRGDAVSYKVGLAPKPIKATVVRYFKAGTACPKLKGDIRTTYNEGETFTRDSVLIQFASGDKAGELRIISAGYLR